MASTFAEFDEAKEDWLSYAERMEQYFIANEIKEEKRRAFLPSVCGPSLYQLIKDLVAPGKPSEQSFEHLVELIDRRTLGRRPSYSGFIVIPGLRDQWRPLQSMCQY